MCDNIDTFNYHMVIKVAEDNFQSLKNLGISIAKIKAVHNKAAASKLSSDDMSGHSICSPLYDEQFGMLIFFTNVTKRLLMPA